MKCTRPKGKKEQLSNTESLPFLLLFLDNNYLQISLLYMAFLSGWKWGAKHTSNSALLPFIAYLIQILKALSEPVSEIAS